MKLRTYSFPLAATLDSLTPLVAALQEFLAVRHQTFCLSWSWLPMSPSVISCITVRRGRIRL